MVRYTNGDELMLEIESQIRITKSKYRELDPNDVIYNPKLIKSKDYFDGMIDTLYWVQARVLANALPSVQPERKKGRWERHNTYHGDDTSGFIDPDWRCSECGRQANVNEWFMYDLTDFCPNCGADMRGDNETTY